jgi:hypothetical protein
MTHPTTTHLMFCIFPCLYELKDGGRGMFVLTAQQKVLTARQRLNACLPNGQKKSAASFQSKMSQKLQILRQK